MIKLIKNVETYFYNLRVQKAFHSNDSKAKQGKTKVNCIKRQNLLVEDYKIFQKKNDREQE